MSNHLDPLARAIATDSPLSALVLELWQRTRIDWSFATDTLSAAFRRHRELGSDERRFVAETLYGLIRHLRRIDTALEAGGVSMTRSAPDRERLLAYLVLEHELPIDAAAATAPRVNWAQVAEIDARIAREAKPARRIALRHSLPDWLADRLVRSLGVDPAEALAAALNQRAPMTVRVNRLATDRAALAEALTAEGIATTPGRWCDTALHIDTRTNLFSLDAFRRGWFEAQDEGSQLVAELVAPPPRSIAVDACAGAGGKTLALAALLDNKGRVVAADVHDKKLAELKRRARRAGATNIHSVTIDGDPRAPWPPALAKLEQAVPRVLVDAPCTGIGALRRNPEARWRLTEADCERMPALQREIVDRALSLVAPGGRLIYATCSLLRVENEDVVAAVRDAHPDLELMPVKAVWSKQRAEPLTIEDGAYLRVDPVHHGTDGFFAAVLRRRPPG